MKIKPEPLMSLTSYTGVLEGEPVTLDFDKFQRPLLKCNKKNYHKLRRSLKFQGVKLSRWPRTYNEEWQGRLPPLELWQLYVLAEELINLRDRQNPDKPLTSIMLKDKKRLDIPKDSIRHFVPVIKPREMGYIIYGAPLKDPLEKDRADTLALCQRNYWLCFCKDKAEDYTPSSPIKAALLTAIKKYLEKESKLTTRRSRTLYPLLYLIVETADSDLRQELENFFADSSQFSTGSLGRSKLRKYVMGVFQKPIKVNPNNPNDLKDEVIQLLEAQNHGSKLSRYRYYNVGTKVIKFTHSIEVASKNSEVPNLKKRYFISGHKPKIMGEGAFAIVKSLDAVFSIKNKKIEFRKDNWLFKKISKKGEATHEEVKATQACAPDLKMHALVENPNRKPKLFMRNAGSALYNHLIKSPKKLLPQDLAKVFYDAVRQVKTAHENNYFMWDVKPENIVYDPIRGKATVIDHGGSMLVDESNRVKIGARTLGFSDPDLEWRVKKRRVKEQEQNVNEQSLKIYKDTREKYMVYSLGMSLLTDVPVNSKYKQIRELAKRMTVTYHIKSLDPNDKPKDAKAGVIYLFNDGNYNYRVRDSQGIVQEGRISPEIFAEESDHEKITEAILKEISEAGYTVSRRPDLSSVIEQLKELSRPSKGFILERISEILKQQNPEGDINHASTYLQRIRIDLLTAIEKYIGSVKKLSTRRAENCHALIDLILNNRLYELDDKFRKFFESNETFYTGLLHRSKLRKLVMRIWEPESKNVTVYIFLLRKIAEAKENPKFYDCLALIEKQIKSIDNPSYDLIDLYYTFIHKMLDDQLDVYLNRFMEYPNEIIENRIHYALKTDSTKIHELQEERRKAVIKLLQQQPLGAKIKRGQVYIVGEHIFVFTHSIEVTESPGPNLKKVFFVLPRQDDVLEQGNFGSVKRIIQKYQLKNNVLKKSEPSCIRKKLHPGAYAEIIDRLLPRQDLERDLQHEFEVTRRCTSLKVFVPIITETKNNTYKGKLFMEDAGKNLWQVPANDLSINQIVKILNDIVTQALTAFKDGFFIADIKPENIVYDAAKQKATIIDHGFTIKQSEKPLGFTLRYLPPPKEFNPFQPNNRDDIYKIMVYSIGVSVAHWMLGERFISSVDDEFDYQAVAELNINEDFKQLLLGMIDKDPRKRATLEEVVESTSVMLGKHSFLLTI